MSDERIDLKKSREHTVGPWYAEEEEQEDCETWTMWGGEHWVVWESDGRLRIDWKKEDAILAASAPILLAELQRCYDLIDALQTEDV